MNVPKLITKYDLIGLFADENKFIGSTIIHNKSLPSIEKLEFPTTKEEAWRQTNIEPLLKNAYILDKKESALSAVEKSFVEKLQISELETYTIVFINGYYSKDLSNISSESKITIQSIAEANENHQEIFATYYEKQNVGEKNLFTALNTGFATDGTFINIPKKIMVDKPVLIIHISDGRRGNCLIQPRNLIIVDENAQVNFIERFVSVGFNPTLTNLVTELFVNENAVVNYQIIQHESDEAFQINHLRIQQNRNSRLVCNTFTLCGGLVRNDVKVSLVGEHAETELNGFYLADKNRHLDTFTNIIHSAPLCTSNQLYRGIINDKGSAVFFGKIFVERNAQKTIAYQSNNNVILTKEASVNSKPQLEIFADDVKCSHGSTVGQIDKEALFYLRSRGISENDAKMMLLHAFTTEITAKINNETLSEYVTKLIQNRLIGM
jgi:Fe-S cluster assembly protein SufD